MAQYQVQKRNSLASANLSRKFCLALLPSELFVQVSRQSWKTMKNHWSCVKVLVQNCFRSLDLSHSGTSKWSEILWNLHSFCSINSVFRTGQCSTETLWNNNFIHLSGYTKTDQTTYKKTSKNIPKKRTISSSQFSRRPSLLVHRCVSSGRSSTIVPCWGRRMWRSKPWKVPEMPRFLSPASLQVAHKYWYQLVPVVQSNWVAKILS